MNAPRVVVLMGAYNEEQYLEETLAAALDQTMPDFALLLHNNGSTDGSDAIMRRFAEADSRIVYTGSPVNLEPAEAWNRGMGIALSEWPGCGWFLAAGADDVMAPDYLSSILRAAAEHPTANLIFSPWQWIGHPEKGIKYFPSYDAESIHQIHQIPAWHACRRELWRAVGGHHLTAGLGSDWDWVVRASVSGKLKPYQLERPYISLRVREGERKSQSEEVNWPTLHRHLCGVARKPVPAWAR